MTYSPWQETVGLLNWKPAAHVQELPLQVPPRATVIGELLAGGGRTVGAVAVVVAVTERLQSDTVAHGDCGKSW